MKKITLHVPSLFVGGIVALLAAFWATHASWIGEMATHLTAGQSELVQPLPAATLSWLDKLRYLAGHAYLWPQFSGYALCALAVFLVMGMVGGTWRFSDSFEDRFLDKLHRRFPKSRPPQAKLPLPPAAVSPAEALKAAGAAVDGPWSQRALSDAVRAAQAILSRQVLEDHPVEAVAAIRTALKAYAGLPSQVERDTVLDDLARCAWKEIAAGDKVRFAEFFVRYPQYHAAPGKFDRLHAFPCTVLLAELEAARRIGPVTSKAFLWTKYVDAGLWHILDNVGRNSYFIEGLGPLGHYEAEKCAGSPADTPLTLNTARCVVAQASGGKDCEAA